MILQFSAAGVGRIPRPFGKNQDDVLATGDDLFTQFVLRHGLADVIAPAMEIDEHVYFGRAAKHPRNEQANGAVRIVRFARKSSLVIRVSLLTARMRIRRGV